MGFSEHFRPGGIVRPALSLSVATIGAGVLALPSTFEEGGVCLVLSVLVLMACMTICSIDYLIRCVDALQLRSYEEISRELLGRKAEEVVRWILITYNVGVSAGYIIVIGEIFTPMLPLIQPYAPFLSSRSHVMFIAWFFVMLPLSCTPHITKMNNVSILGISATMLICTLIIYRYFNPLDGKPNETPIMFISFKEKALLAVPVVMLSFDCQSLIFQVYTNLENSTRHKMDKVVTVSVCLTGCVNIIIGLFGYLTNTPHTAGNILTNYDPMKDHLFAVGESIYSLTVVIAYVLVLFPSRDAVFILVFGYNTATHELAHEAISMRENLIVSVLIALMSFLMSLRASGVVFIIALLGGLCSSTMCYTYPALFRITLHLRGLDRCKPHEFAMAVFMLTFGVVGGIAGTLTAIRM